MFEKIVANNSTLVDETEQMLVKYFSERGFKVGDILPTEATLARELGVARSVLREALSRLKMMNMVESRPRRGMVLTEPSLMGGIERFCNPLWMNEKTLRDLLELRIVMELGSVFCLFRNLTDQDLCELRSIVAIGEAFGDNKYSPVSEYNFHTKLYEVTGNATIKAFQLTIHPVFDFVKTKEKDYFGPATLKLKESGETVSHEDLLALLESRDEEGYAKALRQHFKPYMEYLKEH
jgi:GntR family transcriptional repressor for pyruvate dehydrogenase complex